MRALIRITSVATGESVTIDDDFGESPEWMWTDGNYGCDCNRFLFFERAMGRKPELDDCPPCGEVLYTADILSIAPNDTESAGQTSKSPEGK